MGIYFKFYGQRWISLFKYAYYHISEKALAPHFSTLAWKLPWTEEPGRLQSMGSLGVWHDWATSLSLFTFMHRRRKWQPRTHLWLADHQRRPTRPGTLSPIPKKSSRRSPWPLRPPLEPATSWQGPAIWRGQDWTGCRDELSHPVALMAESKEELKRLLIKVKDESEKVGLKLNIQKTKIMASGPITSWQIDGETMETVRDFIWGAPNSLQMVTVAMKLKDACSLEEKLWPT